MLFPANHQCAQSASLLFLCLRYSQAASLANLLFHEDGQEAVSLGWDVRNISIANDGMRTISRSADPPMLPRIPQANVACC